MAEEAAWYLGFAAHDIPVLVANGLLKPVGHPADNAVKFFALAALEPLRSDTKWLTVLARLARIADLGIAIADELLLSACQIRGVPDRQRTAGIYLHCTDENDVSLFLGFSNTLLRHNRRSGFGSAKSGDYVGKSVGGCLDPNRWPAELACR